jgi:UDP-hydrolysing UDP-N-acetyl-D-glucosamine 2-epimerase
MIGPEWAGDAGDTPRTRIAVVTGSRADFGLLTPVMRAIEAHDRLDLLVIAAGSHLIAPAITFRDIKREFSVADSIPMQTAGKTGRFADVESLGRGVSRFGRSFELLSPAWVVVLGDRIEAFAAASAAAIAGIPLAHIHGGDRAEGIADESMRHAITKLANLHFPATTESADRIRKMGEREDTIFTVGSPAIDGLDLVAPMTDDECETQFGTDIRPGTLVLLHPAGIDEADEEATAHAVLRSAIERADTTDGSVICLAPNHDPGRDAIVRGLDAAMTDRVVRLDHLPRPAFLRLLKRLAEHNGVMVGNSSAGLIEAPTLGVRVVNVGPRQAGRERPEGVVTIGEALHTGITPSHDEISGAIREATASTPAPVTRYGDGNTGTRIAELLATQAASTPIVRKRNVY